MNLSSSQTVSEIAAQSLAAVRVFEKYGIDYCCGGRRPVADACSERGIDSAGLFDELSAALADAGGGDIDWATAPLSQLIGHIVDKHHTFVRRELPRLAERLEKVVRVYGVKDAAMLTPLPALLEGLGAELDLHIRKEEIILFPYIEALESASLSGRPMQPAPFGSVANPIAMMEGEHDDAGAALAAMRAVTNGYTAPEHACITYRALFDGLRELEADLHLHIHLENNVLFPRALELERM